MNDLQKFLSAASKKDFKIDFKTEEAPVAKPVEVKQPKVEPKVEPVKVEEPKVEEVIAEEVSE